MTTLPRLTETYVLWLEYVQATFELVHSHSLPNSMPERPCPPDEQRRVSQMIHLEYEVLRTAKAMRDAVKELINDTGDAKLLTTHLEDLESRLQDIARENADVLNLDGDELLPGWRVSHAVSLELRTLTASQKLIEKFNIFIKQKRQNVAKDQTARLTTLTQSIVTKAEARRRELKARAFEIKLKMIDRSKTKSFFELSLDRLHLGMERQNGMEAKDRVTGAIEKVVGGQNLTRIFHGLVESAKDTLSSIAKI